MTPDDFRRIALSMPGAEELSRYGKSHFRVGRKTFATFEGPGASRVVLNLTADQQTAFTGNTLAVFAPVEGGDGRLGITSVRLEGADKASVTEALEKAWSNAAPKRVVKRRPKSPA
jgi:hypothetical protein